MEKAKGIVYFMAVGLLTIVLAGCGDLFNTTETAGSDADSSGSDAIVVVYNANEADSGDVPEDTNVYSAGDTVTVLDNTGGLTRDGFAFNGWSTAADGSGELYQPGDTFDIGFQAVDLYAFWQPESTLGWGITVEGDGRRAEFLDAATDSAGNLYAVGNVYEDSFYDFGNGVTVTGTGGSLRENSVLVKYNSHGEAQWANIYPFGPVFRSVTVSADNTVYVAGSIGNAETDFGNDVTVSGAQNGANGLVLAFDANGTALHGSSTITAEATSVFERVAVAPDGSVFATGYLNDDQPVSWGGSSSSVSGARAGTNSRNALIVQFSSDLIAQVALSDSTDESGYKTLNGVAATDTALYVAGLRGRVTAYARTNDPSALTESWTIPTQSAIEFRDLVLHNDVLFVAGAERNGDLVDFGNGVTFQGVRTGHGEKHNGVLVSFNATDGEAQWARGAISGDDNTSFRAVGVSSDGFVYVAGSQDGPGVFGYADGVVAAGPAENHDYSPANATLIKYTTGGQALWVQTIQELDRTQTVDDFDENAFYGTVVISDDAVFTVGAQRSGYTYIYNDDVSITVPFEWFGPILMRYGF